MSQDFSITERVQASGFTRSPLAPSYALACAGCPKRLCCGKS